MAPGRYYEIQCKFPKEMTHTCPVCGKKEYLVSDADLGEDGIFWSCHEHRGGCGSTFRVTPDGDCIDIF